MSGQDAATLDIVAAVYASVVTRWRAQGCIDQGGRAAKVIENTQRDLNIALMNELAILFEKWASTPGRAGAAGTKWNFPVPPGLVGGHCIGVDPYYLTHKAEKLGYIPAGDPGWPAHQRQHGQVHRPARHQRK